MDKLYYNTITPLLKDVLLQLMHSQELDKFRLVGGTALSLQLGHRLSVDIDLFTGALYESVDFQKIDDLLREHYSYVDAYDYPNAGMGKSYYVGHNKLESIKLDIFYTEPYVFEAFVVEGIRMASIEEIIAMKLDVISRNGRKKDFWDLHELSSHFTLDEMLALHQRRYPYSHNANHIKQQLTAFKLADEDFVPNCLKGKHWEVIKLDMIDFANGSR